MHSRNAVVCALLAAAGTTASAGVFTWIGGNNGLWNDPLSWSGPGGEYPRLVGDTATVAGSLNSVSLVANTSLGHLNIYNGASVYSSGHSLFIDGDAVIFGVGSSLSVADTPALRDLDVDAMSIDAGILAIYGGTAQFDESLTIGQSGGVLGVGIVEMNGSGNLTLADGALWAKSGSGPMTELIIRRSTNSSARLDWTSPESSLIASDGKTLHVEMPYSGALGGRISVSSVNTASAVVSDNAFVAGPTSEIRFSGSGAFVGRVEAPAIDSYGAVTVNHTAEIDANLLALRGDGTIAEGQALWLDTGALILDSFAFNATGDNARVVFQGVGANTTVTGGATVFDLGETGTFDLDGSGDRTITVNAGSSLDVLAGAIDTGAEIFGGTLNIAGAFHIESYGMPSVAWQADGAITMQGGTITGRRFRNSGEIAGRGTIDTLVQNDGLIEAVGGTLFFDNLDPGGTVEIPGAGVVRAEQGDISVQASDIGGYLPTHGGIFVGNGSGIREVFEMNRGLLVGAWDGDAGLVSLNSGFFRVGRIRLQSAFTNQGDSVAVISGNGAFDAFELSGGTASIEGTLEVRGNAVVWDEAQVLGSGVINASQTTKSLALRDGADTGSVGIQIAGMVELGWYGETSAMASAGSLAIAPTGSLAIDIAGDEASGSFDALSVVGDASIDGTLVVRWSADLGDAPIGETYTVLSAGSASGAFDAVDFAGLGTNRRAHVSVHADRVDVTVTCLGDLNADGVLDLSDITAFVEAFTGGDPAADVAPPLGLLDLNDINAFVFFFQGGCN
jgi:hypothetical protein